MSDRVAGAGSNSAHQQAHAPTNAAAANEAGRPSCGIAGMGSTDPVVHLPDFPLAEASFSSANAPASCRAEDAPQARPATPSQNVNAATAAWTEQLNGRLSRCYTAGDFVAILKELTDPEQQRFVVDRALRRFMDLGEIDALARQVQGIPGLRTIVAQQLLKSAAHPEALRSAYARGSRVGPDIESPELRKEFASRCAAGVLVALPQNELGAFLSSRPKDDGARFALALSGAHSSRSLSAIPELAKLHDETAGQINRVLEALNKTPTTPTTGAIVQNLCSQILHTDLAPRGSFGKPPLSSDNVANAIANLWYPDDPAQAGLAAEHLKGLLADRQGARLLFEGQSFWRMKLIFEVVRSERSITSQTFANYGGDLMRHPAVTAALARKLVGMVNGVTAPTAEQAADAEDAVRRISGILQTDAGQNLISGPAPVAAKLQAWAAIARDKRITAKTFTSENPFANQLLMERIAPLYAAAGAPQEFPGNSLRNMVGLAMGLTPTLPKHAHITAEDLVALKQALAEGKDLKDLPPALKSLLIEHSLFAKNQAVDTIVAKIDNRAYPKPPRVAFEFNVVFTELGPIRCPAFRVQVADFDPQTDGPKFEYFDNTGRNYPRGADQTSRDDYLNHNRLPAGVLYYTPHDPFGTRDENGVEKLARRETPAANSRMVNVVDTAALAGCFAAAVVGVVVSGGTLALAAGVVGGAGAGWSTYRGSQALADRAAHGQGNNPFAPGQEGREAFLIEVGVVATATSFGAFSAGAGFLGLRAMGAIGGDAQWAVPWLRTVNVTAAGTNIAALTVDAADLAANAHRMTDEERARAAFMLVFHSVLAAKPLVALHAGAPANTLPPLVPQPAGPSPQPPAELPHAVARTGSQNQNFAVLNGSQNQNTSGYDPTRRTTASNSNVTPDTAQAAAQQPAQQPVALVANGGPSYVPTGLDPAQVQAVGHTPPPGPRPLTSVPPAQPTSVPAAPANPPTAHPRLVRRAGSPNPGSDSEPNPSGRRPAEPPTATPPGSARSGQDISLRGSLRTQRPDFWLLLPPHLQKSGSDNQVASWLSANRPQEWANFVKWLRDNNYDAYAALPDALKLPQDRTPATVPTSRDNANERPVRQWLDETGLWGLIPEELRQGSAPAIAQWLESKRPDLWKQFAAWLKSRVTNAPDDENTRFDSPPVPDVRGGRFVQIDAGTFVASFWGSVRRALPYTDLSLFREKLMISLDQIARPHKLITVRQFLAAVRASADSELGPEMAATLNREVARRLLSPDELPEFVAGEIDPRRSPSQPGSFRPDDRMPLDRVLGAL